MIRRSNSDDAQEQLLPVNSTSASRRPQGCWIHCSSYRYFLAVLAFFGFVNVYCLRVNLSVAIVAMVNQTSGSAGVNRSTECPVDNNGSHEEAANGEMNWNKQDQGLVLGAFFYGYITTQIVGGWLAGRFGGKYIFGIGVLITSALTLLTPVVARWNVYGLVALRVIEGVGEGVTFPAMHAMFSRWAPPQERSRAVTFVYAGAQLGTVIGMPVSGWLSAYGFAGGWPSVFYVFGIAGCLWCVIWFILCFDSPAAHPYLSPEERFHIENSIGNGGKHYGPVPWRKIATSMPVWACCAAHFANNWGYYTLLTCLPMYLSDVLHFDIHSNGLLSGLPYFACWITMTASGPLADWLRAPGRLSTTAVRKLFGTVGLLAPGALLVSTGYLGCNRAVAVGVVSLAVGLSALTMACYGANHLDLAPAYAGTLMGITNSFATIPGFVGPQVVGALTMHNSTSREWEKVFYITAGIYCFGTLMFLVFGSGERQPWATPQEQELLNGDENHGDNDDNDGYNNGDDDGNEVNLRKNLRKSSRPRPDM